VDDIIFFNALTRENIYQIIDIELKGLYSRIESLGYVIEISTTAKDFLVEKGFDEKFGARPLKRAIQKYLEDQMAEVIIESTIKQGDKIFIDLDENKENLTVQLMVNKDAVLPDNIGTIVDDLQEFNIKSFDN